MATIMALIPVIMVREVEFLNMDALGTNAKLSRNSDEVQFLKMRLCVMKLSMHGLKKLMGRS